ncbi:MAG TPA: flavoprotein [bacterium]|nr:flavoprotein [bacterium]
MNIYSGKTKIKPFQHKGVFLDISCHCWDNKYSHYFQYIQFLMKKNIVIGICGSIAAYKVPSLIRKLQDKNWNIKVIMTQAATEFITPLTIETISKNKVYIDLFKRDEWEISHISLSEFGNVLLIIPATGNIIGKIAAGIADDLLSSTVMAFSGRVIFAPAMNVKMWGNPIVQENVKKLKKLGYKFIGPEKGKLANGTIGQGRLSDIEKIVEELEKEFTPKE